MHKSTNKLNAQSINIQDGGLDRIEVINLLQAHHNEMLSLSPPESVHALDLTKLATPDITFWSVWVDEELAGCGALKKLQRSQAEIKSMRTSASHLRKGIAKILLSHIIDFANQQGYQKLYLETGTLEAFQPAQRLYESFGFIECEPFADYSIDPYSKYMSMILK